MTGFPLHTRASFRLLGVVAAVAVAVGLSACTGSGSGASGPPSASSGDYAASVNSACRSYWDKIAKISADAAKRTDQPDVVAREMAAEFATFRDAIGHLRGPETDMAYVNQTFETMNKVNGDFSAGSIDGSTLQSALKNLNSDFTARYPGCKEGGS